MNFFEIRWYNSGYTIRLYCFILRWNKQQNYSEISFSRVNLQEFRQHGGMTYKEIKLARKQREEAAALKRLEYTDSTQDLAP